MSIKKAVKGVAGIMLVALGLFWFDYVLTKNDGGAHWIDLQIAKWKKNTYYVDNSCDIDGDGTTTKCGEHGPFNSLETAMRCTGMEHGDRIRIRQGTGFYEAPESQPVDQGRCKGVVIENDAGASPIVDIEILNRF